MGERTALTHEQILALILGSTDDGVIVHGQPGHYKIVGKVDPKFMYLLRASASQYQTLNTVQKLLEAFLTTADLIKEHAIAEQLERITASIDLVLKFSRDDA